MKLNTLFFLACMVLSTALLTLPEACTPAQRIDALSAAAKGAPCLEACAPLLLEEVASVEAPASSSSLAFSLESPPPRRARITVHRRCSGWVPVLADAGAGADASREAGP